MVGRVSIFLRNLMPLFRWAFPCIGLHFASWPASCEAAGEKHLHLRKQQRNTSLHYFTIRTHSRICVLNKEQK
jgi:hypothetical protein